VPIETPTPAPPAAAKVATVATIHSTVGDDAPALHAMTANPMRVETAAAPERGIFETVIGSLLSFFLG
jgi:hypothetical protein